MTDQPPQTARREIRDQIRGHLAAPAVLAALAGTAILLVLAAPFETGTLPPVRRALYWTLVVGASYAAAVTVAAHLAARRRFAALPVLPRLGLSALAVGLAVAAVLVAVKAVALGVAPALDLSLLWNVGIAALVTLTIQTVELLARPPAPAAAGLLAARLPLDRRGRILALSAEDHYTRVLTDRGSALVLIRLTDAIAAAGAPGLRVHRSHWVALSAVASARRSGETAVITLSSGDDIPVSRSHIPAVKAAGLLPRG